jgi:hypothetical protein
LRRSRRTFPEPAFAGLLFGPRTCQLFAQLGNGRDSALELGGTRREILGEILGRREQAVALFSQRNDLRVCSVPLRDDCVAFTFDFTQLCFQFGSAPLLFATSLYGDGDFSDAHPARCFRPPAASRVAPRSVARAWLAGAPSSASAFSRSCNSARLAFSASSVDSNFVFRSALVASSLRKR